MIKKKCYLTFSNGESWSKLRPGVNLLLKRPLVSAYHEKHKSIAKLHVVAIGGEVSRDNEQVLRDVTAHCTRYTLDGRCGVCYLNLLKGHRDRHTLG